MVVVSDNRDLGVIKTALEQAPLIELPCEKLDSAIIDSVVQQCGDGGLNNSLVIARPLIGRCQS